jgi:hypothetical protein
MRKWISKFGNGDFDEVKFNSPIHRSERWRGYADCNTVINRLKPTPREKEQYFLLEGSQATAARPSGRNNVKVMVIEGGFRQTTKFWISDCFIDNLENN